MYHYSVKQLVLLIGLSVCWSLNAQLPVTHLYAFEWTNDSNIVGNARFLTHFNAKGYNNQPEFTSPNSLCFTLAWHIDDQTDLYELNLENYEVRAITQTQSTFEYSPRPVEDKWTCVRVDTAKNQMMWSYPIHGEDQGKSHFSKEKSIGYYRHFNNDSVVLFFTGDPNQMGIGSLSTGEIFYFTSNIGRTFFVHGGKVVYLHKLTEDSWYLKEYDPYLRRASILAKSMSGIEDFFITEKGEILSARGTVIYRYDEATLEKWTPWLDLSAYPLDNITRIIANDRYLIVVDKKNEE